MFDRALNIPFRDYLLTVMLAVAATPCVAQNPPVPDLSGQWDHPGIPGFEPLSSGPTSLVNLSRREGNVANNRQLVGDYRNPILKPGAAAIVRKFGEMSLAHIGYPTARNQCWPGGVPFEFTNDALLLLQTPTEVLLVYRGDHQVRRVRLNQPHPAHLTPSWFGDSVGHYEGDTLVIDTVGVKIGPYPMLDWYGTPYSPALHVTERYRLLDYASAKEALERNAKENFIPDERRSKVTSAKYLQLLFTVEDPGEFTTPWSATMTYTPFRDVRDWIEDICAENPFKYGTEKDTAVPAAGTPDF